MLDSTDRQILSELSENGRMTMKELGEKVHLTGQAASDRVQKLEENGIIEGYSIKVNQAKLGSVVHVLINVYTIDTHHEPYLSFMELQRKHIVKNYKISGDSCYIIEGRFPSNKTLDEFLIALSKHVQYKLSMIINQQF